MLRENSNRADPDSSTVLYFRRTCEQIEQEIHALLKTMAADKIP